MKLQIDKALWTDDIVKIADYLTKHNINVIYDCPDSFPDEHHTLKDDYEYYKQFLCYPMKWVPKKVKNAYLYAPRHDEAKNIYDVSVNNSDTEYVPPQLSYNACWPSVKNSSELVYILANLALMYKIALKYPMEYTALFTTCVHSGLYNARFNCMIRSLQNNLKISYMHDVHKIYQQNRLPLYIAEKLDKYLDYVANDIGENLKKVYQLSKVNLPLYSAGEFVLPNNLNYFEDKDDLREYERLGYLIARFVCKCDTNYNLAKAKKLINRYSVLFGFDKNRYKMCTNICELVLQLQYSIGTIYAMDDAARLNEFLKSYKLAKPGKRVNKYDEEFRTVFNLMSMIK